MWLKSMLCNTVPSHGSNFLEYMIIVVKLYVLPFLNYALNSIVIVGCYHRHHVKTFIVY